MAARLPPEAVKRLASLHRLGWCQRDIALKLSCAQSCVMRWLRRLGLAPNGYVTKRAKEKKRKAYAKLIAENGISCLAELARIKKEIMAARQKKQQQRGLD